MIAAFLSTRLGKLVASLTAAIGILLGAFLYGKKTQRGERQVQDMEDFIETKKDIDNVEVSPTRDAAVERLRDNGWTR